MIVQVNLYPISKRVVVFSDVAGRVEDTVTRRVMSTLLRKYRSDGDFELIAKYHRQLEIYARKGKESE